MSYPGFIPPDPLDLARNRALEPLGERLREELTEWLEKNQILSCRLDTAHHVVRIDWGPCLPPRIKPVLTLWGSIYLRDDLEPLPPEKFLRRRIIL